MTETLLKKFAKALHGEYRYERPHLRSNVIMCRSKLCFISASNQSQGRRGKEFFKEGSENKK